MFLAILPVSTKCLSVSPLKRKQIGDIRIYYNKKAKK